MIETEKSKQVSNEQLLTDIHNTEKELHAYKNLWMGYEALSELPENEGYRANMYRFEVTKFQRNADECEAFLKQLYALRNERGI